MKFIYGIFCIIASLTTTTCRITDRLRHSDLSITTLIPSENETQHIINKIVQEEESPGYLDDVLLMVEKQKWSAAEKPCVDNIKRLLYSLQNLTLWAVWDWDSFSSEPQGILFGNRYQFGNFDQCMNAPWAETHPHLKTKYCLAEVVLERADKAVRRLVEKPFHPYQSALDFLQYRLPHTRALNELTWGACVPAACAPRTVERFLGIVLTRSHLGAGGMKINISIDEECQTSGDQRDYDILFYTFFIVMGSITLVCLICTYLNSRRKESDPKTIKSHIVMAFCIKKNATNLLWIPKEDIAVVSGIRCLTMCLLVLDHQISTSNAGPISDGLKSDQYAQSPVGLLYLHDDIFVDTFFLLSGFLTFVQLRKFTRLPYIFILKRYLRLVVPYAVMIFYISAVFPYTGTGPLWNRAVLQDTDRCRKNWWLNVLMVSNYVDTENVCMVTSWYIPCDFHFYVVTFFTYGLYKLRPRLGLVVAAVLTVGSFVLPGIINYMYQLSANLPLTIETLVNIRGMKDYHIGYIKSHMRYAAYLVGFYSGWIFAMCSANGNIRLKQKWSILGACLALTLMLVVMMFGGTFLWRSYSPLEGAIYAALNRPAWACGVAIFIFCCIFGHIPLVNSFLCWYLWLPLSRLSYGLYLTHAIMITRNVYTARNPHHNDGIEILNATVGVLFGGLIAALVLWLLVECPVNNLLSLCLKPKSKKITTAVEELNLNTVTATTARANP